jgi:hypothetical protein
MIEPMMIVFAAIFIADLFSRKESKLIDETSVDA